MIERFLERFPIASAIFLFYALVGGLAVFFTGLSNGEYVDSLLKVGAGTGAIGLARAHLKRP